MQAIVRGGGEDGFAAHDDAGDGGLGHGGPAGAASQAGSVARMGVSLGGRSNEDAPSRGGPGRSAVVTARRSGVGGGGLEALGGGVELGSADDDAPGGPCGFGVDRQGPAVRRGSSGRARRPGPSVPGRLEAPIRARSRISGYPMPGSAKTVGDVGVLGVELADEPRGSRFPGFIQRVPA